MLLRPPIIFIVTLSERATAFTNRRHLYKTNNFITKQSYGFPMNESA